MFDGTLTCIRYCYRARQRDIARLIDEMLTHKVKVTASELQQLEEACRILDKAAHEMAKSSAQRAKNSVTFGSTSTEGSDGAGVIIFTPLVTLLGL